jgi:hypothetical protein
MLPLCFVAGGAFVESVRPVYLPTNLDNTPEQQDVICYNADVAWGQDYWLREASSQYAEFILVMGHGDTYNGEWMMKPDHSAPVPVRTMIDSVRSEYPGVRIVLIVCNPGGHTLDDPGVTYATDNVWVLPDRFIDLGTNLYRDTKIGDGTGNIYEFVENP